MNTKSEFYAAFAAAPKRTVQIGSTLHVAVGDPATHARLEGLIKEALVRGEGVSENGVTKWIDTSLVIIPGGEGSARYVWKAGGQQVKAKRELCSRDSAGTVTRTLLNVCWIKP